jgi:hypothetical protein
VVELEIYKLSFEFEARVVSGDSRNFLFLT